MKANPIELNQTAGRKWWLAAVMVLCGVGGVGAQGYEGGVPWGVVEVSALREGSGLSCGWRNEGMVWTHNDGNRRALFAVTAAGVHAGTFTFADTGGDVEEMAAGPGGQAGEGYLYVGDIGGNASPGDVRASVKIVRVPEPEVGFVPGGPPVTGTLTGTGSFTLVYPDGSYDAEAMVVDPLSGDLYLFTKTSGVTRVYRAEAAVLVPGLTTVLELVALVGFGQPSAAAISRDGGRLVVRDEDGAVEWVRRPGETLGAMLMRPAVGVPVIGRPREVNGEAIAYRADGNGYLTLSEGVLPVLYYFQGRRPAAAVLEAPLVPRVVLPGATVQLMAAVSGFPVPVFTWRRNGEVLAGQTTNVLTLTGLTAADAGSYEMTAVNGEGSVRASVVLTVLERPDVRITEVQTAPGSAQGTDWWELTNFEPRTVDLSGWRFNDESGDLTSVFVFPEGLVIEPGESVIFADGRTAEQFRAWWGAGLPAGVKVVNYSGSGLALAPSGDRIRVWDNRATGVGDVVVQVTVGNAVAGTTFGYEPVSGQFGGVSQVGVHGAFRSATGTDTGSPGRWLSPAVVPVVNVSRWDGGRLRLGYGREAGHWYTVETAADPAAAEWTVVAGPEQAKDNTEALIEQPMYFGSRFYRVRIR
jgi:hypothetical protein